MKLSRFLLTPRSNWGTDGTHVAMQTVTYDYLNFAQYNAADQAYTVTYALSKVDFSQCKEVYFGIVAATAAGDCTINVGGAVYTYNASAGYLQMKVVIKDNTLYKGAFVILFETKMVYEG